MTGTFNRLATHKPNLLVNGISIGLAETDWNLAWCQRCYNACDRLHRAATRRQRKALGDLFDEG